MASLLFFVALLPVAVEGAIVFQSVAAQNTRRARTCRGDAPEVVLLQRGGSIAMVAGVPAFAVSPGTRHSDGNTSAEGRKKDASPVLPRRRPPSAGIVSSSHGVLHLPVLMGIPLASEGAGRAMFVGVAFAVLQIIGPGHLGTQITLSAAAGPNRAFAAGAGWGGGHCVGMLVVIAPLLLLGHVSNGFTEAWERIGDYCVGALMVICAVYFLMRQSAYLEQGSCTSLVDPARALLRKSGNILSKQWCQTSQTYQGDPKGNQNNSAEVAAPNEGLRYWIHRFRERSDSLASAVSQESTWRRRGALLGFCQGCLCPSGLVGLHFVKDLRALAMTCFLGTFVLSAVVGTGCLAVVWARVTRSGMGSNISPKFMYLSSCICTLLTGIVWIVATFCGLSLDSHSLVSLTVTTIPITHTR